MGYQVLRAEKLSTNGNVGASIAHAFRARETPNADMERTPKNQHIGAKSVEQAMAKYRALLPEKPGLTLSGASNTSLQPVQKPIKP